MARIPEDELERIKREIAVADIARSLGIELKSHGANLIGLCPFHDDHEPSFVVTPGKNLWHCLGACQSGGSNIDLVMRARSVSFRHAVEILRTGAAFAISAGTAPKRPRLPSLPALLDGRGDGNDATLLGEVVRYYHETLEQSPEALAYLESRGLASMEMIERFQIGYANRTLGYRLPPRPTVAGARLRGRLQQLGIVRESGHEHFAGSIVIPIVDEAGRVTEMYGRKITPNLRPGTPRHLYLPRPHSDPSAGLERGLWNLDMLQETREVILCEALIDALTFWSAGFHNVTASYGVEGFTNDHLAAFILYRTERVLIAYDRDQAGDNAAEKVAAKLQGHGIGCFRVEFPKGMDANQYARKVQPAAKSLALLLGNARWMGHGTAPAIPVLSAVEGTSMPEVLSPEIHSQPAVAAAKSETADTLPTTPSTSVAPLLPLAADPPPPVSPAPAEVPTEIRAEEIIVTLGDRKYRIRGLAKNLSYDALRVNVLAARGDSFHVDTLDLYTARQRTAYIKQAAEDLGLKEDVIKKDLGKVLLKLEELQDELIRKTLEPQAKSVMPTGTERDAALDLLNSPDLLGRILADFERCGVVGEQTNKLVGYLAAVSRKLDEPLAVIVQSSSAAGKSSLMDAILAFMPEEERVKYSAMTGQSLFYMGETNLKQKILAIVEEEGAARAGYALKLLQSEGELTIASTGKDPETGKLVTHEYHVEGPVMIFLTTTAIEIDEELLNRCLVLTVNEDREQTRAIHKLQRERQTLEGLLARHDRNDILTLHRNAQRLLKPLLVANPFARELTFLDTRTRTRRDHMKYLTLIRAIALLHQYQRPVKAITNRGKTLDYIEVTRNDIATANRFAHEVLGRSLDELSPQTRRLLQQIDEMVSERCRRLEMERSDFRFSRKNVREHTDMGDTQLKHHLHRLEELEYLLVHRGGRGQSFVYELLYNGEGQNGRPFLIRLINPERLPERLSERFRDYDEKKSGVDGEKSGASRPQVGAKSGGGRVDPTHILPMCDKAGSDSDAADAENAHLDREKSAPSYPHMDRTNGAAAYLAAKVDR